MGSCQSCTELLREPRESVSPGGGRGKSLVEPMLEPMTREQRPTTRDEAIDKLKALDLTRIRRHNEIGGRYVARISDMYDGDTIEIVVKTDNEKEERKRQLRLFGCDTPELRGPSKEAGYKAKNAALRFLGAEDAVGLKNGKEIRTYFDSNTVIVEVEFMAASEGVEKFGRDLAKVYNAGGCSLTEHLIKTGNAKAYFGGTKEVDQ